MNRRYSDPMELTPDTIVVAAADQVSSEVGDDETVMLGLREGVYFGTGGVGSLVWREVRSPTSLGAIADTIVEQYEVDRDRCLADLFLFTQDLLDRGLVEVRPSTG